jgi:hypothetical protein
VFLVSGPRISLYKHSRKDFLDILPIYWTTARDLRPLKNRQEKTRAEDTCTGKKNTSDYKHI